MSKLTVYCVAVWDCGENEGLRVLGCFATRDLADACVKETEAESDAPEYLNFTVAPCEVEGLEEPDRPVAAGVICKCGDPGTFCPAHGKRTPGVRESVDLTTCSADEMELVKDTVAAVKRQVLRDIKEGHIPPTVKSFSELHDYVDANMYGYDVAKRLDAAFWNRVQGEVDAWLKSGRPLTHDEVERLNNRRMS